MRHWIAFLGPAALCACATLPRYYKASDPLTAAEHDRLGAAYEAQGLLDDARHQYQAALALEHADPQAWVALGDLEFRRGDYRAAERDFRRALKAAPARADALNNLAMTYLARRKNLTEARRLAEEALSLGGPVKPYALDTLAGIQRCAGLAR
ncbi:MAG: tetratricopeptide repeat protein [Elusimicrobia bacterium]|nr:tetratricopeptide repeat protein [Elusimicrobiota bacterium]